MGDLERLAELRRIRRYTAYLFIAFVLVPIFIAPYIITTFESDVNEDLAEYWNAFIFNYEVITGAELTDASPQTNQIKALVGILSLLYLVFFGFIVGLVTTSVQIRAINAGLEV